MAATRAPPVLTRSELNCENAGWTGLATKETDGRPVRPVECRDLGAAAGPGPGDDVGFAVAVQVAGRDVNAPAEAGVKRVKALEDAFVGAGEDLDVGAAARAGASDDVGFAVAVDIPTGHFHAAVECRSVGKKLSQDRSVGAGEDLYVRPAAGTGAGNDVGVAIVVHVAGGDIHAAGEIGLIGIKAINQSQSSAVVHLDVRAAAGAGGDDQVWHAVAVHVASSDPNAAGKCRAEGQELGFDGARRQIDESDQRGLARVGPNKGGAGNCVAGATTAAASSSASAAPSGVQRDGGRCDVESGASGFPEMSLLLSAHTTWMTLLKKLIR